MDNKGLVAYAKRALAEKWGYVWGTFGQVLTLDLLTQKIRQYSIGVGNYAAFIRENYIGRRTADCVGLIKGYYWTLGDKVNYVGSTDVSADGMYERASTKGSIESMPDIEGICVYKQGHIGIYIGNGQVIEAHGTLSGVIQTQLKGGTPWTHWLRCPYISYIVSTPTQVQPTATGKMTVTASVLNVRDGQGTNHAIVGTLRRGAAVRIDQHFSSGWTSIYFGDHGGFVSTQYLK